MLKCNRCGKCCYYFLGTKYKRCKHLKDIGPNKTECDIYFDRIGKMIDGIPGYMLIQCVERKNDDRLFLGCPYNEQIKRKRVGRMKSCLW